MKRIAPILLAVVVVAAASPVRAKDRAELLAKTDEIAAKVADLRGLKIVKPIARGIKDRDQIRASVLENIDRETTAEQIAVEQRVLKRLGMLAPDADYKAIFVELATEQIAGFYDPWKKELYIAEGVELAGAAAAFDDGPMVMAHEIDHALQDQHFDLRKLMDAVPDDNSDMGLARQALVEGDGMAAMIEYMFATFGADPPWGDPKIARELERAFEDAPAADSLSKAPLFMQVSMLFPYASGLRFVMTYRRHHPWKRIDEMYAEPPVSTEQILHPKKYSSRERPDEIAERPVGALADHRRIYLDVTGEVGFSTLLREHGVEREVAEVAAAGWGGDRLAAYAPKDGDDGAIDATVVVSYSVWDDPADAIELFDALVDALPRLAGAGKSIESGKRVAVFADAGGDEWRVQRDGDAVIAVLGAPKGTSAAIAADVAKSWKVTRR